MTASISRIVVVLAVAVAAVVSAVPAAAIADSAPRLNGAFRITGSIGMFDEVTWAGPGVDLVGTVRLGPQRGGFLDVQLGYSPLDNHNFLSDALVARASIAGGVYLLPDDALRVGAIAGVEEVAFHSDPDVLNEHPGVDLVARRGGPVPSLGAEVSYTLRESLGIGLYGRAALTDLALFRENDVDPDITDGEEGRAHLVLVGFFIEIRAR